jgi:hypothetical protein
MADRNRLSYISHADYSAEICIANPPKRLGAATLLRLSRRFELGFGRSPRLRLQFGLGLADALSAANRSISTPLI